MMFRRVLIRTFRSKCVSFHRKSQSASWSISNEFSFFARELFINRSNSALAKSQLESIENSCSLFGRFDLKIVLLFDANRFDFFTLIFVDFFRLLEKFCSKRPNVRLNLVEIFFGSFDFESLIDESFHRRLMFFDDRQETLTEIVEF